MRSFVLLISLVPCLCACSTLLPYGSTKSDTTFSSFEQAHNAAQRIKAQQTLTSELKSLGFDPQDGRNVTLISYPEIVGRLTPYQGVPLSELDPGIRQCIREQAACRGYLFRFESQSRRREGDFFLDFFNLRRITHITGWWFETLIVVADDKVLFRNLAGQAHIERVDRQTNPLGPFQPAGEGAGALLMR